MRFSSQNWPKNRMNIASLYPKIMQRPLLHSGLLLLALSVTLHFAGLSRINALVFDEVYYAKYGHAYFHGQTVFDVHPPLGKYMVGLGMWIADGIGYSGYLTNTLTGAARAPWAYRWVNALFGSMLPLLTFLLVWQLTQRVRAAALAGVFMLCSGLFLVEARYGLINIFMVVFGMAGHWLWLRALDTATPRARHVQYALAGLALGACVSVKWNGAAYLGIIWALTGLAWLLHWRGVATAQRFAALRWHQLILYFLVVPALFYSVQWIPHIRMNTMSFTEVHDQMLGFHKNMKDGPSEHPYCSRWYSWPLMLRPISYLYEQSRSKRDPLPPYDNKVPQENTRAVYVAHALGNPLLSWWTVAALLGIATIAASIALRRTAWLPIEHERAREQGLANSSLNLWPLGYVLLAFIAGWLPWAFVGRCQFLYLYMPSFAFAIIAAALMVDWLIARQRVLWQRTGYAIIALVIGCFVYFAPLYLAIPISPAGFHDRMWLCSWI
jgi:dolichyl-phosphate-mannose-protein mannosyltransferase